jgi:hypothetical protein
VLKGNHWVAALSPATGSSVSRHWYPARIGPGDLIPAIWRFKTYAYFNSLPTDPAKLAAIINASNKTDDYHDGRGAVGVFNDVETLLDLPIVLSPKVRAAFYAVLAGEPGVRFQSHVTDVAGRTDVAFSIDERDGTMSEILINPTTYAYMGQLDIAMNDLGCPNISQGSILDEQLQFAIVQHKGQVP